MQTLLIRSTNNSRQYSRGRDYLMSTIKKAVVVQPYKSNARHCLLITEFTEQRIGCLLVYLPKLCKEKKLSNVYGLIAI